MSGAIVGLLFGAWIALGPGNAKKNAVGFMIGSLIAMLIMWAKP